MTEPTTAPRRPGLAVHYQPIVELASGQVVGVEALLRSGDEDRAPVEALAAAEASGEIVELGRWVLREATREVAGWHGSPGARAVRLSVNVSPREVSEPGFVAGVAEALHASGLPAERLQLELTECVPMDLEIAAVVLGQVRELGVHVAIDDFGAGYGSFSYLQRVPADVVKLDRASITRLAARDGARDRAIVGAVVALAHDLGITTVAEGVEAIAPVAVLRTLGCDLGQGYLWSPALAGPSARERCRRGPGPVIRLAPDQRELSRLGA